MATDAKNSSQINNVETKGAGLENELKSAIAHYNFYAKTNYRFALLLAIGLIVSSLAGLIGGLAGKFTAETLGIIAAIPTGIAFIATIYNPQQRANWHYAKKDRLNALRRKLLYELPDNPSAGDIKSVSESWEKIDAEMNVIWENGLSLDLKKAINREQ